MNIEKNAIVKFEGSKCGACKAMEPTWKKVKEKNIDKNIIFQNINVDDNTDIIQKYEIIAIPTFMALKDGKEIQRVVGITDVNGLQKIIDILV